MIPIETILVVLLPSVAAATFVIRYFWKKSICFKLMKKTITDLSDSEDTSHKTHEKIFTEINKQGNRITALESKVDLLLDHFDISSK